jgi:hypothetical protein
MANGPWISFYDSIREHPKTYKLAGYLNIESYAAVGIVTSLCSWASVNADTGNIGGHPPYAIARAVGWERDGKELIEAMIKSGHLEEKDDGLYIHDFWDYAGKLIERRRYDRARKRDDKNISVGNPSEFRGNSRAIQYNTILTDKRDTPIEKSTWIDDMKNDSKKNLQETMDRMHRQARGEE